MRDSTRFALLLITSLAAAACRGEPAQPPPPEPTTASATVPSPVQDAGNVEQDLTVQVGAHQWTSALEVGQTRREDGTLEQLGSFDPNRPILVDMTLREAPAGIVGRAEIRRGLEVLAASQVPVDTATRRARIELEIPKELAGSDDTELVILVGAAEQRRMPLDL